MQKRLRPFNWIAIAVILGGLLAAALPPGGAVPVVEARPLFANVGPDSAGSLTGTGCTAVSVGNALVQDGAKGGFDLAAGGGGNACIWQITWSAPVDNVTSVHLVGTTQLNSDPHCYIKLYSTVDGWHDLNTGTNCGALVDFGSLPSYDGVTTIEIGSGGHPNAQEFRIDYIYLTGDSTATATPTPSNTPTPTATPTFTPTPTPTNTPVPPTAYPTSATSSGNLIQNWDFNIAPKQPAVYWQDINRVVQAPSTSSLPPKPIEQMPFGSCGPKYYDMDRPTLGSESGTIWQDFDWPGGRMYINMEALTDTYLTRGQVSIIDKGSGATEQLATFTNGSFNWLSFRWQTASHPAGQYRLEIKPQETLLPAALAVDNVNVRTGYWNQDCPAGQYHGSIGQTVYATATNSEFNTQVPPAGGVPLNMNCDFEQNWNGWAHNPSSTLRFTGGGVGPTFPILFSTSLGFGTFLNGNVYTPFDWPGGSMYVSYFTNGGSTPIVRVRSLMTGWSFSIQTGFFTQSFNGWQKHSAISPSAPPGQYIFEASVPSGRIMGLDGAAVSAGSFASGPCSSATNPTNDNATATQNAIGTTAGETAAPAATQTANAIMTQVENNWGTYEAIVGGTHTQAAAEATQTEFYRNVETQTAGQTQTQDAAHATQTEFWGHVETQIAEQTAAPGATLTAIWDSAHATQTTIWNGATQTQAAGQTATAIAVATAQPTITPRPSTIPPATVETPTPAPTCEVEVMVCTSVDLTLTAGWSGFLTAVANFETQAVVNATETQARAGTQTQAVVVATTQMAMINQTATARALQTGTAQAHATQTAAVAQTLGANATGTAIAFATAGAATVAAATQTAAAQQTILPATGDANQIATATALAAEVATSVSAATATAVAQGNTNATSTAQALATGAALGTPAPTPPPVDERPPPQPGADCIRPASPLYIADWIDYEVCQVLTWFVWTPDNSDQLQVVIDTSCDREPFGTLCEVMIALTGVRASWQSLEWDGTGLQCTLEDTNPFLAVKAAYGILLGDFAFETPENYDHSCGVSIGWLVGDGVERGTCYAINLMCAKGLMQWMQLVLNGVLIAAWAFYFQAAWIARATEG